MNMIPVGGKFDPSCYTLQKKRSKQQCKHFERTLLQPRPPIFLSFAFPSLPLFPPSQRMSRKVSVESCPQAHCTTQRGSREKGALV